MFWTIYQKLAPGHSTEDKYLTSAVNYPTTAVIFVCSNNKFVGDMAWPINLFYYILDRYCALSQMRHFTDNFIDFIGKSEIISFCLSEKSVWMRGGSNPQPLVPTKELTHRTGALAQTFWNHFKIPNSAEVPHEKQQTATLKTLSLESKSRQHFYFKIVYFNFSFCIWCVPDINGILI
jgi:hypothetical protein